MNLTMCDIAHCLMNQNILEAYLTSLTGHRVELLQAPSLRGMLEDVRDVADIIAEDLEEAVFFINFGQWAQPQELNYEMMRSAGDALKYYRKVYIIQIVEDGHKIRSEIPPETFGMPFVLYVIERISFCNALSDGLKQSMKDHLAQSWPSFEESLIAESRAYLHRGREKAAEKCFEDFSGTFAEQYAQGYVEGRIAGHVEKVNELVGIMRGVNEESLAKAFCISVDAVRKVWSGEKYNPCPSII